MARIGSKSAALTHSQEQIWIGQRLHPDCPLYNMAFAFVFPASLRADVFTEAWRRVAGASDALRTRLAENGGELRRIMTADAAGTEVLDFSSQRNPEQEFQYWCQERCTRPLSLAGKLVDSVFVRLGDGRTGWYLNQHHLVADAWSTQLLYRQVGAEYETLIGQQGVERPTLQPYYPTTALLSRFGDRSAAQEHWKLRQTHGGRTVPLYGRSAAPVGTANTRWTIELDQDRSEALNRLSGEEGFLSPSAELSRFALWATLFLSWLHRISGRADISFDAPVSGRPTGDAKRSLGLFIEMFPFAAHIDPQETLRSFGAKCLEEAKLFLRHGLPGMSAPSGTAVSNFVLNYFPAAFGEFAGLPAEVSWVHPGHADSVHTLRLQVHDFAGSGRYVLHFDYNEGALPEQHQQRSLEHFEKVLEALLADPDQPLGAVDIRVEEERQTLAVLNSTDSSPLPDQTVIEMFQAVADRQPGRVAVREGSSELSFADLREQSEALAATLVKQGVGTGDRVAVISRRSMLAVIAILATLRARAAYVPINPSTPPARLDYLLHDSGASVVLVGEGLDHLSIGQGANVLSIPEGIRSGHGAGLDLPAPSLDDLSYLMYTSGSTGQPKGVLVEHGGLADYLCWASRRYVRADRLTFPLFTSLAVDLTITSLFLPLITGGLLDIYPETEGPADTALTNVIRDNRADFIKLTPSHLSLLVRIGLEGLRIRRMVVGGESLPTRLAAAISTQLQDEVELYNEYGPTEAVVGCVAHRYEPERDTDATVPIGRPADHVQVEVLNEALSPVPEGVPGELWVSRFGLARGYQGLEKHTAERFRSRPDMPGRRGYRTGDLVRMATAGKLEYLGRMDRQLKVAGFRIEPAEIEAAMLSLPGVEQCAVIARQRPEVDISAAAAVHNCARCGLPSNYPRAVFDDDGICSLCRSYESIKDHAQAYFKSMDDLRAVFAASAQSNESEYDCLMLYSGGKDSTYALCQLVDMGLSVYAFTLDNGFIADGAKKNIRRVTAQLGVPVELATTPAMNAIFRDSLVRFADVCQGCFKTIYSLSMKRAREMGIPIIVTGLSRGQMFQTRLTEEMFRDGRYSPEEVDAAVLAARKVYHRVNDEVRRSLDVRLLQDDRIFDEIRFVDFYRYCDVGLDEVLSYLERKVPWVRPEETGRSTNCLINDVGIYVHQKQRGYHNYALPYSWDVRLGHKTREAAQDELDDVIDLEHVRQIMAEIEYDEERTAPGVEQTALYGFYVASQSLTAADLRQQLTERLPSHMVPVHLQQLESIPLTASGKADEMALSRSTFSRSAEVPYRAPVGPVAEYLVELWQQELELERVGADDSFFELGGTSLSAIQVVLGLCREFDIDLPLEAIFSHPVLGELAKLAEDEILADVDSLV